MDDQDAYSVRKFAKRHDLSPSFVYAEWRAGRGPRYMQVGDRRIITREAGADWRRELEAETRKAALETA
jgi:hypothetical protein